MANIDVPTLTAGQTPPIGWVLTWQATYRAKLGGGTTPNLTGLWDAASQLCCADVQHRLLGIPLPSCTGNSGPATWGALLGSTGP